MCVFPFSALLCRLQIGKPIMDDGRWEYQKFLVVKRAIKDFYSMHVPSGYLLINLK
jgi:hypothetical protein